MPCRNRPLASRPVIRLFSGAMSMSSIGLVSARAFSPHGSRRATYGKMWPARSGGNPGKFHGATFHGTPYRYQVSCKTGSPSQQPPDGGLTFESIRSLLEG
jgi:hypothetical protein